MDEIEAAVPEDQGSVVIIGAGPAGLTAAWELVQRGFKPIVLERDDRVGGLARTEWFRGFGFDIGGHRFFTHVREVDRLWQQMLGPDFRAVRRSSRIHHQGRSLAYPLDLSEALPKLGLKESLRILTSYLKARLVLGSDEKTLEGWLIHRFGQRLYDLFFKDYTAKVWGVPGREIKAEWAEQRLEGLSLKTAVWSAFLKGQRPKTLIDEFHYPVCGAGSMWRRFQEKIAAKGGQFFLGAEVVALNRREGRVLSLTIRRGAEEMEVKGEHFISTMDLSDLITRLRPEAPGAVLGAAASLTHRALMVVGLIVDRAQVFADNWIYVHDPGMTVGRIQNFKNWSPSMAPDQTKTGLGMEYFVTEGDELWRLDDAGLIELATAELAALNLAEAAEVEGGAVFRQPRAYPVYNHQYRPCLEMIQGFLSSLDNITTVGRNGMHRYNNQDHSMLTAMLAVENLFGGRHDLWRLGAAPFYPKDPVEGSDAARS